MRRLKDVQGFSQRHFDAIQKSKFIPDEAIPYDLPYHRSAVDVSLIRRDVLGFQNDCVEQPNSIMLRHAIARTREDFRLPEKVKMLHLNDVFKQEDLQIWSSSPGLPWKDCGYKTKGDIRRDPEAVRRVRKFWHLVKGRKSIRPPDSLAYVRSHLAKIGEEKVRAVWGYPATMTFGEAVFALPLIAGYRKAKRHLAYGYEVAVGGFKQLYARFCPHPNFITMDFKNFDKTVPAWLIRVAFDILLSNLDLENYEDYGVADVRKMLVMWDYIVEYFVNTTIRLCNGERYKKSSGVASGSYFTQLIDSIVNSVLINWMILERTGHYPLDYVVMGDDSLIATHVRVDLDDLQDMLDPIGMLINFRKSAQSSSLQRLTFIGYEITVGIPSKPEVEFYSSLCFPERPDRCLADVQNRALGLLYANLGEHVRFHDLCAAIVRLKPFDLSFSPSMRRFIALVLGCDVRTIDVPHPLDFLSKMM